jgi:hypothetical protein
MTRCTLLLLPILLLAGCGGHAGPPSSLDRVLRGEASAHFVLDGTVRIEATGLPRLLGEATRVPFHSEGDLSPSVLRAQGSAAGLSDRVVLRGGQLRELRRLLRKASWSGDPERLHMELELTYEQLERVVPSGVPPVIEGAHVSATVNLQASSEEGS